MRERRIIRVLLTALVLVTAASRGDAQSLSVSLSVDTLFPLPGGVSKFTVTGPPGAEFEIWRSPNPGETFFPAWGTVFIDISDKTRVGKGILPQSGTKIVTVGVPNDPTLVDTLWYFQARAWLGQDKGASARTLAQRIVSSPPAGARRPEALAVTPDGTRAFVVNEADVTVQVLDAVNDVLLEEIPVAPPP